MWTLLTTLALAAPIVHEPGSGPAAAGSTGSVDEFVVLALDLDKGLVAFRNVLHLGATEEEPVSCEYAGMQDRPHSGVELGLYDLSAGKPVDVWIVYAVPGFDVSACTPHEESKRQLDAAKARFTALGLDISKPPKPVDAGSDGSFALGGVRARGLRAETKGDPVAAKHLPTEEEIREDAMADATRVDRFDLLLADQPAYRRYVGYSAMMAGHHSVSFPRAYVQGGKVVFLERHDGGDMRSVSQWHAFTPVFSLR